MGGFIKAILSAFCDDRRYRIHIHYFRAYMIRNIAGSDRLIPSPSQDGPQIRASSPKSKMLIGESLDWRCPKPNNCYFTSRPSSTSFITTGSVPPYGASRPDGLPQSRFEGKDLFVDPDIFVDDIPPFPQRLGGFPRVFWIAQPQPQQMTSMILCVSNPLSPIQQLQTTTYSLPGSSWNPFRAWKMLRLLMYCTSPF